MMGDRTYTPDRRSYFATHYFGPSAVLLVALVIFFQLLLSPTNGIGLSIVVIVVLTALVLGYVRTQAMYRKRHYTWTSHALHYRSGGLFSDRETELKYPHITHVRLIKPFIRHRLFGTGYILIEAAGSSGTEVIMEAINDPDQVYRDIQNILARNTFRLTYSHKLAEERPAPIAVMLELTSAVTGTFLGFLFLLGVGEIGVVFDVLPVFTVVVAVLVVSIVGPWVVFVWYQDLVRRTYYIYDDVISYTRGFLTKQEAFMPVENLSDAELRQTLIDKVLGLYDVVVSCQGSGSQIHFKNLRNGVEVESFIDRLINSESVTLQPQATDNAHAAASSVQTESPVQSAGETRVFYRDTTRTLLPYTPLVFVAWLFPPLLVFPLWSYITLKRTEYRVGARSVGSYFNFLTTKNIEFSQDKITGVVLRRNIVDRRLGTCQIDFWSIGSGQAVTFQHIPYTSDIEQLVREKAGFTHDTERVILRPDFSLKTFLLAHIYTTLALGTLFVSSAVASIAMPPLIIIPIILGVTGALVWVILLRRYRRAYIRVGVQTVYMRIGWLSQREFFVRHENVKDITSIQYPFTHAGTLQFNVAGEQIQSTGGSGSPQRIPNHFSLAYIHQEKGVFAVHDTVLDTILAEGSPPYDGAGIDEVITRPALANDISIIVFSHMLAFPLLLVLPLSILGRVIWLRHVSYAIQPQRIVARSGIAFRRQTSIVFSRIDYMKHSQGILNKIWRNGTIYLYTTGSSTAELAIKNSPEFKKFHTELKQRYES